MSKLVQDLISTRDQLQEFSDQLNDKVEHIILLLLRLVEPEANWEDQDGHLIWWWYGSDDNRPFRRGDRHGYFHCYGETFGINLDEPHTILPGFDSHIYSTPRMISSEKTLPLKYLEMTDEEIIADASAVINKISQDLKNKEQASEDAKLAALSKLTDEEKKILGLK